MNIHSDKTQENKSQPVANEVTRKQAGGDSTFQFIDNRPEAITQRKLQAIANNSPQVKKLRTYQTMASNTAKQQHPVLQQKQGYVKPTRQMKSGMNINGNERLENGSDLINKKGIKSSTESIMEVSQFKGGVLVDLYNPDNAQNTIQRKKVIQRIIVVADSQLDYNQFVGVYQMLMNGIDKRVTLLSILKKSKIEGEQIGLRGHGDSTGKFAGMKAEVLAGLLKDAGVNETNPVIDLLSCNSGKGGDTSYAEQFANEMGHLSTVYANKGLGVLMDDGYSYSKRDRTPEETKEYKAIFKDCKQEVALAEVVAAEGKALLSKPGITEDKVKEIFLVYGSKVRKVADTLYNRLYAHQKNLIADHDDPNSGLYISPKK